jgi:hypothetical protein
MHPIVDALPSPIVVTRSDARLQVDDPRIGPDALEFGQRIAPDVRASHRFRDGTVARFGERDVLTRVLDIGPEDLVTARMGQDLIDTTARHDVAAEEQRHVIGVGCRTPTSSVVCA